MPWDKLAGISLDNMVRNLRNIGASVGAIRNVKGMQEIISMLPRDGSVILVSFLILKKGFEARGHAMCVFYDHFGRLRIMDRTTVYDNLAIIAKIHSVDEMIPRAAVQINNVYAKLLYLSGTAVLAMEALGVVATEKR